MLVPSSITTNITTMKNLDRNVEKGQDSIIERNKIKSFYKNKTLSISSTSS
jgi:hypothetical protein